MILSIIVPVYNVQEYLADCVRSLTVATEAEYEILLVNDGSTDQSGALFRMRGMQGLTLHAVRT